MSCWGSNATWQRQGDCFSGGKGVKNGSKNLEMSEDFGLSMMEVLNENKVLFKKSEELKKVFVENDLADWYICIIHLDENNKLSVDFDYAPWLESDFGPSARMDFFEYKYLGKQPANEKELEQFKAMEAFQREHNSK